MSTTKHLTKWTKDELLKLPKLKLPRDGNPKEGRYNKIYDEILLLPTEGKIDQESGFGRITLIGVEKDKPTEIITTYSTDLRMFFADGMCVIDCLPKSGAFRVHKNYYKFFVRQPTDTAYIKMVHEDGTDFTKKEIKSMAPTYSNLV